MPPSPPAAVVFDHDGLLLDTESLWTRAERTLFARRGAAFTLEHKRELLGTSREVAGARLELMLELPGEGSALVSELHELVLGELDGGAEPMPGADGLVAELRGRGMPLAVVSNSPPPFVHRALEAAGLRGAFKVVLTAGGDLPAKPAPDLYLEACARLGAAPAESVAFEDSPPGVASALAAGMIVVAVPSLDGVDLSAAHLVTDSLSRAGVRSLLGL